MNRLIAVVVAAVAIAFGANVASAGQCPLLIKQLREARVDASKQAQVKKLTDEAENLHKTGKHAESVQKCDEAAKVAGIELKKKM